MILALSSTLYYCNKKKDPNESDPNLSSISTKAFENQEDVKRNSAFLFSDNSPEFTFSNLDANKYKYLTILVTMVYSTKPPAPSTIPDLLAGPHIYAARWYQININIRGLIKNGEINVSSQNAIFNRAPTPNPLTVANRQYEKLGLVPDRHGIAKYDFYFFFHTKPKSQKDINKIKPVRPEVGLITPDQMNTVRDLFKSDLTFNIWCSTKP